MLDHLSDAPQLPDECGHKDWVLGCPRCFYEAVRVAQGNIKAETAESHMEGAILIIWHLMVIMADMEDQLRPMTQSIDLSRNQVARDLINNLRQLSHYMMGLGSDAPKLQAALAQGALLAAQTKAAIDARETGEAPPPKAEPSRIILTDR